ncbi:MAG: hypothetical protein AB7G37_15160, partial [Solirubrobacteraceae bacterium]
MRATGSSRLGAAAPVRLRVGSRRQVATAALTGRWFWGWATRVDRAWDNRGVYFVDERYAYRGLPEGGLPRCTKANAPRDGNGNQGDGCVRWNLNAKTGRLTVGDLEGTLRKGRLELDVVDLWPLTVPG